MAAAGPSPSKWSTSADTDHLKLFPAIPLTWKQGWLARPSAMQSIIGTKYGLSHEVVELGTQVEI
jgi:hypothetical protein